MAEYVRFVSYLYEYQGNERKKNVGFVRYEIRSGQKRVLVSVNGVHRPDRRMGVYAFYREMDSCIGIQLGVLVLKNGRGTFQYSTYADGPGEDESECRFEDIAGIVVGDEPAFCTVWDNDGFNVDSFVKCREDLVRIRPERETAAALAREPEPEEMTQSEPEPESEPEELPGQEEEPVPEELSQPLPEPVRELPVEEKPGKTYALYKQTTWDKLCKLYPKVLPFPYDAHIRALRIRPGDLGRLPRQNWGLAKNSFMLHGFFQYKYILILDIPAQSPEYEERFMVAVPGIFSQMDKYLAEMFGFYEFLGSPKQEKELGSFGYWVSEIKMDQE